MTIARNTLEQATFLLAVLLLVFSSAAAEPSEPRGSANRAVSASERAGAGAPATTLVGRAILPAATLTAGDTSGRQIGPRAINGQAVPFVDRQPVQGFSAILQAPSGRFLTVTDNGFGSMENSADFHPRVYTLEPSFKTHEGGSGRIEVLNSFTLRDPDRQLPYTITEAFTPERRLTGADLDPESFRRAPDGTFWFGDEFGPFLVHTSADGKVLEPPIPLPDFDRPGQEIRSPQNPLSEEGAPVRIMNAMRHHAQRHGSRKTPVCSPWYLLVDDGDPGTGASHRLVPPPDSGLAPASSEIFSVQSLHAAGYAVVVWTINTPEAIDAALKGKVDGIISDRPDLLLAAVQAHDADGDGAPGDLLTSEGLIDPRKFDAQGHRGARDLRPENTLPAMEAALDHLMTTLETDCGVTKDGIAILNHDPYLRALNVRCADGSPYRESDELLVKDLTAAEIQRRFVADKVFRGPQQRNDPTLSPVSLAFFDLAGTSPEASTIYRVPTLEQLFAFVRFYEQYYSRGAGASHPQATKRATNAARVRFNIETKLNPRSDTDEKGNVYAERTLGPSSFLGAIAPAILAADLAERTDLQSFDFRTLLLVHQQFPAIRTVCLFGDFPKIGNESAPGSDDGTNLQPQAGGNTPWLAGLRWPYRVTAKSQPFRLPSSGGFEGMAISVDGRTLLPLLEKPLVGGEAKTLLIHPFDLATRKYTGERYKYVLAPGGKAIGDFVMFSRTRGLVIERDSSQGDLNGFKMVFGITLGSPGEAVDKWPAADLLRIDDPHRISSPGAHGDVGVGNAFAFPFATIENLVVLDHDHIGVMNDNNYPFSVGRHVGTREPDDSEFVLLKIGRSLDHE